ncbi:homogentisate 1,2-dioxygenase [Phenylobacterium sp.]|uniref:homogentisate 1,2-dioxygenase n=1 Tax=Phenylobacterium sp. TaxID=1871053 RepID=UPI0035B4C1DF
MMLEHSRTPRRPAWIAALVLAAAAPAAAQPMAQPAPADCAATDANLPADLAGWTSPAPLAAAAAEAGLDAAQLQIGRAYDIKLSRTPEVAYLVQPEKPGGSVSYGGLLAVTVPRAGSYRVALGSGAWLDVLADGAPVASTAHGHGPACSSVRKMVTFPLAAGRHVIQISANGAPAVAVMVVQAP